jgi:hypothetical protein
MDKIYFKIFEGIGKQLEKVESATVSMSTRPQRKAHYEN